MGRRWKSARNSAVSTADTSYAHKLRASGYRDIPHWRKILAGASSFHRMEDGEGHSRRITLRINGSSMLNSRPLGAFQG